MIVEFIKYLLSTASPVVKKAGYLHEAIAIESRYKRAKESWQSHIDHTWNQIISVIEDQDKFDSVIVAGAGSLHDIPVDFLANKYNKVTLIDIVFTYRARKIAKRYSNIELYLCDLSGIQEPEKLLEPDITLPVIGVPHLPEVLKKPDLFLSVNLLSQLAVTPRICIEKHGLHKEHEIDQWCNQLLKNQILFMKKFHCPVFIISDFAQNVYDKNGGLLQHNDMLYHCNLPGKKAEWLWEIAPSGELKRGYQIRAEVGCWLW